MQFLYGRHPEIGMRIELLIKPGRSAFVSSDAQEIGPWIASKRPVLLLMLMIAGATVESRSPPHVCIIFILASKKQERAKRMVLFATKDESVFRPLRKLPEGYSFSFRAVRPASICQRQAIQSHHTRRSR